MATTDSHAARNTARALVERLAALPMVAAVDLLAPDTSAYDSWAVEATVAQAAIPASVSREIGRAGAELHPEAAEADHRVVVAVV